MFEKCMGISLHPGERMTLSGKLDLIGIKSGKCELYVNNLTEKSSLFLMELSSNQAAFALDSRDMEMVIFAVDECEICTAKPEMLTEKELAEALQTWYGRIAELPFIAQKITVNTGIKAYLEETIHRISGMNYEELCDFWGKNQRILARELKKYFKEQADVKAKRVKGSGDYHQRLMDASINNLLQKELLDPKEAENQNQEKIAYVVRRIAKSLDMPTENISMSARLARRFDQMGLLQRLVQKGNMAMRLVKLEGDWYKQDVGTIIGYHGDDKELVALVPMNEHSYRMYDMDHPEGIFIDEAVAKEIDVDAFQCYAGFPNRRLTVKDLLFFMFKHCWKRDYQTIIFCSLLAGLIPLVSPVITETIFSDIIPIRDHVGLAAVTQIMMITGFVTAALSLVRSIATLRITNHLDMSVEAAIWARLLRLPAKFFRQFECGELLERINGIDSIKQVVSGQFVSQVFNFFFSFWSIALMFWYSWKLTLEALAVWAVYMLVVAVIYRRIIHYQRKMIAASNKTAGLMQQIFNGLAKFRVHGAEHQAFYLWSKVFGEEWKWNMKLRWQSNYNSILGSIQPFILSMLLYYTAMYGMQEVAANGQVIQHISYAKFLAFQSAFSSFNSTVVGIIPLVAQFFTIKPHVENLRPILNEVPEVMEDKMDADVLTGHIKIEHLAFSYTEDGPEVLKDINLEIKAGEHVAIVGRSGCGKSTLLRLLLGMEKPKRGEIYYDYRDMQELNLASIRCQLGVVLQNGQLMTGDIFSNIVGTSPLTKDDAWKAAELVGIADDIREMPMGMNTIISEGSSNISGGQRQRLLIARALAGNPAIVMLDEATSSLDNHTQSIVTESLDKMKATRIVIAHRLSTIKGADRIILLDNGVVAEQGTFEELMKMDGIFARLAKRQLT